MRFLEVTPCCRIFLFTNLLCDRCDPLIGWSCRLKFSKVVRMGKKVLFAVLLAAGSGHRFGSTKQLQNVDGVAMVAKAARLCESVCGRHSVTVLGNDWMAVHDACKPLSGFIVMNLDYATGIASSIRCGVAAVQDQADGIMLVLADQPRIGVAHLQALEWQWRETPTSIIASAYADTLGPPIIFPRQDFAALRELRGDAGAKSILLRNPDRLQTIDCAAAALDIDVPEDLQRI